MVLEHSKAEGHMVEINLHQPNKQPGGWNKFDWIITLVVANNHQMGDYWSTKMSHNLELATNCNIQFQPTRQELGRQKEKWLYFACNSKSNGMCMTHTKDLISKGQKSVVGWKHPFFPSKVDFWMETSFLFFLPKTILGWKHPFFYFKSRF
jgi:hypothetical protein